MEERKIATIIASAKTNGDNSVKLYEEAAKLAVDIMKGLTYAESRHLLKFMSYEIAKRARIN